MQQVSKRKEKETKKKQNGNEMETKWKRNGNETETKRNQNGNEMGTKLKPQLMNRSFFSLRARVFFFRTSRKKVGISPRECIFRNQRGRCSPLWGTE